MSLIDLNLCPPAPSIPESTNRNRTTRSPQERWHRTARAFAPVFWLTTVVLFASPAPAASPKEQNTVTKREGSVTYRLSHKGMGAMTAMLPKEETVIFKNKQLLIDMGRHRVIVDRAAGTVTNLMEVGSTKVALRYPLEEESGEGEFEYERTGETKSFSGVTAERVDIVDPTDPSNRLSVWMTEDFSAKYSKYSGLKGFAMDFIEIYDEGERRAVAEKVDLGPVSDELFLIPEDFEIVELSSATELGSKIQELLGAQVITKESH